MTIFTIGFTGTSAAHFFERLRNAGVSSVIDTRLNNVSQLAGFAKKNDLKYFLRAILDVPYYECHMLAPEQDMLKQYRKKLMAWQEYERAYRTLLRARPLAAEVVPHMIDSVCLLCSEADAERCHRRLAAEYLAEVMGGANITHL